MSNKSKLNSFTSFEMDKQGQELIQGGTTEVQIDALRLELATLKQDFKSLAGYERKTTKTMFLEQADVIKCEIERLQSLDTGGNGDGVW